MVKNKKSELFFIKAVILFAAVFCAVFIPRSAYAATTLKKLEPNKIYKTYDFNRDGKKDSFKYSFSNPRGKAIIYLNGRRSTAETVRSALTSMSICLKETHLRKSRHFPNQHSPAI